MTEPLDAFGFPMRLWISPNDARNVIAAKIVEFRRLKRNPHLLEALRQGQEGTAVPATPQLELFA
jgi:hypothetical protein